MGPTPGTLQERRERAVAALVSHYAADHISLEEFERRVDVVQRTADTAVLDRLLGDLPALPPVAPATPPKPVHEADRLIARGADAVRNAVKDSQTLVAIMGGVERRGRWTPARRNYVIAMMGGADLDFREARLAPGVTEVFIVALMGGADIIVPPDLAVDASGLALLGGFGHQDAMLDPTADDAPVLKIRGVAAMGGVDISVRRPGETARDAKRRVRDERKRLPPRP